MAEPEEGQQAVQQPAAAEQAAPAAQGGEQQQPVYSQEFLDKMESAQSALGGLDNSQNVYDTNKTKESSFNLEEAKQQNQPQQVADPGVQSQEVAPADGEQTPLAEGQENPEGAPAAQGSENVDPNQQNQPASESTDPLVVSSQMTGDIDLSPKTEEEAAEAAPQQIGFNNYEEFEKFLTDGDYGVTAENLREELPKMVEERKSFEEKQAKLDNFNSVFENLPTELFEAIKTWGDGGDYRAVIENSNRYDLDKPFEDHGNKEMVEAYFEGKISQEEWEEFSDKEGDPETKTKVSKYVDMAKDLYGTDQAKFKTQKITHEESAAKTTQVRQTAFDTSRENFPKKFEGKLPIKDEYVSQIDGMVKNSDSVLAVFFNPDGSHKPDAHARMAMAFGGEELVLNQAEALKSKIVSQARAEVLKNTPDSTQIKKTAESGKVSDMEAAQAKARARAEEILGKPKQSTY